MRGILTLIGLAVVLFAGIGWYQGWYKFKSTTNPDGTTHYELDVNKNKISNDTKNIKNKVVDILDGENNTNNAPGTGLPTFNLNTDQTTITFPGTNVKVTLPGTK